MTREQSIKIKVLMLQAGISAAEIGRRLGTTRQAVTGVINGQWKSPRVRKAISETLGVPHTDLWNNHDRAL
jgi:transcriptional regulator with XRE-family HTH domain